MSPLTGTKKGETEPGSVLPVFAALTLAAAAHAQTVASQGNSNPHSFANDTQVLGTFFAASDGVNGMELWHTSETGGSTRMVADIWPGSGGSAPTEITYAGSGVVFFAAGDGVRGRELWRSDGTTTTRRQNLRGTDSGLPLHLTMVGSTLFYTANDTTTGRELWKDDGGAGGPTLVTDLLLGPVGSSPHWLTAVGNKLFFAATTAIGTNLYVHDATTGTTTRPGNNIDIRPTYLTEWQGKCYYVADVALLNREVFCTDGSTVTQVTSGTIFPQHLEPAAGLLFFVAYGLAGGELWATNGGIGQEVLVKDINPGNTGSDISQMVGDSLFLWFSANDGSTGAQLWRSDGSTTTRIWIPPGVTDPHPTGLTPFQGGLLFAADGPDAVGRELYRAASGGTTATLVKDIWQFAPLHVDWRHLPWLPALPWARPVSLRSDGSSADNVTRDSNPGFLHLGRGGNHVLFAAEDSRGIELWISDGSTGGTQRLKDIDPQPPQDNLHARSWVDTGAGSIHVVLDYLTVPGAACSLAASTAPPIAPVAVGGAIGKLRLASPVWLPVGIANATGELSTTVTFPLSTPFIQAFQGLTLTASRTSYTHTASAGSEGQSGPCGIISGGGTYNDDNWRYRIPVCNQSPPGGIGWLALVKQQWNGTDFDPILIDTIFYEFPPEQVLEGEARLLPPTDGNSQGDRLELYLHAQPPNEATATGGCKVWQSYC